MPGVLRVFESLTQLIALFTVEADVLASTIDQEVAGPLSESLDALMRRKDEFLVAKRPDGGVTNVPQIIVSSIHAAPPPTPAALVDEGVKQRLHDQLTLANEEYQVRFRER